MKSFPIALVLVSLVSVILAGPGFDAEITKALIKFTKDAVGAYESFVPTDAALTERIALHHLQLMRENPNAEFVDNELRGVIIAMAIKIGDGSKANPHVAKVVRVRRFVNEEPEVKNDPYLRSKDVRKKLNSANIPQNQNLKDAVAAGVEIYKEEVYPRISCFLAMDGKMKKRKMTLGVSLDTFKFDDEPLNNYVQMTIIVRP